MAEAIDAGSSSSSSSSSSASILPCETLWIANLADKIKKGPMKDALYRLYSSFGSIKGISVTKTKAMRGQAFISFADVAQASAAMRDTQGQLLFGKPIRVEYAKAKSDAVLRTQHASPALLNEQRQERAKRRQEKGIGAGASSSSSAGGSSSSSGVGSKRGRGAAGLTTGGSGPALKRQALEGTAGIPVPPIGGAVPVSAAPSKTLLVSSLPADATEPLIRALFGRFPGFAELRHLPERGLAFCSYSTEQEATAALLALNGFRLTNMHSLAVAYSAQGAKA